MVIALLLHITLALPPTPAVPPATLRAAAAEAAALWVPYGVAIDVAPCDVPSDEGIVLILVPVATARAGVTAAGWRGALAAISFDANGAPEPRIRLFLTDFLAFVASARIFGQPESQWPHALREELIGRVLGRVLAHEIGHFVLRMPRHTSAGLMRSLQFADELVAPSRRGFALTGVDTSRLAAR
jgi:hypothetical protein